MLIIIRRYILKEFFPALLLGLFIFTFVLLLDRLFDLISIFLNKQSEIVSVLKLFYYLLPSIFSLSLPMAMLFALIFTFTRFSESKEIVALQVCGIRLKTITWPLLFLNLLLSFFLVYHNTRVVPESQYCFKKIYAQIAYQHPELRLEEKNFWVIGDYRLWVEKIQGKNLKNVMLFQFVEGKQPLRIAARKGKYHLSDKSTLILDLEEGSIQYCSIEEANILSLSKFQTYRVNIPLEIPTQPVVSRGLREMKSGELQSEIKKYQKQGIPTSHLEVEYHLRVVLAATCFIFALVGIPLGINLKHSGRTISFGVSLLIVFFYYLLMIGGIILGERKILPPFISLWIPNLILFLIGGSIFYNLSKH